MPAQQRIQLILSVAAVVISAALVYVFFQASTALQQLLFVCISLALCLLSLLTIRTYSPIANSIHRLSQQKVKPDILLVDDNPANRRITGEMLSKMSLFTLEAASGRQALGLYQRHSFKLILMDLEMDDIDGIEATRRIRIQERDQRIPIIAISAHNTKEKKLKALIAGFDDYLSKPVEQDLLKNALDRWLTPSALAKPEVKAATPLVSISPPSTLQTIEPLADSVEKPLADSVEKPLADSVEKPLPLNKVVDIEQSLAHSRNDRTLAKDMLSMLLSMIGEEKDNMVAHFKQQEWDELGYLVHKLSGGCCYCGVPQLQQEASIVDRAIDQKQFDTVKRHFPKMLDSMDALLVWQEQFDIDIIFEY
ncbi:MAG: response regulator [Pseudomonadota bacterium]